MHLNINHNCTTCAVSGRCSSSDDEVDEQHAVAARHFGSSSMQSAQSERSDLSIFSCASALVLPHAVHLGAALFDGPSIRSLSIVTCSCKLFECQACSCQCRQARNRPFSHGVCRVRLLLHRRYAWQSQAMPAQLQLPLSCDETQLAHQGRKRYAPQQLHKIDYAPSAGVPGDVEGSPKSDALRQANSQQWGIRHAQQRTRLPGSATCELRQLQVRQYSVLLCVPLLCNKLPLKYRRGVIILETARAKYSCSSFRRGQKSKSSLYRRATAVPCVPEIPE